MATAPGQGCSPKKEVGGRLKQDLHKDFFNNLGLHTCCTKIILHGVSVSNQSQQWTNFCTNFSPKKSGSVGDASPLSKKVGGRRPHASPPHYTPDPGEKTPHRPPPYEELHPATIFSLFHFLIIQVCNAVRYQACFCADNYTCS